MLKATSFDTHGNITVTWNSFNDEKLTNPDGSMHLLPCSDCQELIWVPLNVVALTCDACRDTD